VIRTANDDPLPGIISGKGTQLNHSESRIHGTIYDSGMPEDLLTSIRSFGEAERIVPMAGVTS